MTTHSVMTEESNALFADHIEHLYALTTSHLAAEKLDRLFIASGSLKYYFLDDHGYPFKSNPHFTQWVPLLDGVSDCWLVISTDKKPQLLIYSPDDFWHMTPSAPNEAWCQNFDIVLYSRIDQLPELITESRATALIAEEKASFLTENVQHNPKALLNRLHYDRAIKTPWEQHCLREANRIAVKGHVSAVRDFEQGLSEFVIHQNYLAAIEQQEKQLPYNNIIALNEHTAVLHYQHKEQQCIEESRSLLVDAGATYMGYAADITRTVAVGNELFQRLLSGVDQYQQEILRQIKPGVSFVDLHRFMHQQLFKLLTSTGIVKADIAEGSDDAIKISQTFCPHGLGHFLGLQVHDVGGWQHDRAGLNVPPPAPFNFLRLTRTLEVGQVLTIEPGLYFIPSLLDKLKESSLSEAIDWVLVDSLIPWGGIRIEDNICVTAQGHENYTRDAFSLLN